MEKNKLHHYRTILLKRKKEVEQELERMIENGTFGLSLLEATEELSAYDNHPGDLGNITYEIEKDIALVQHEKSTIQNINRALEKIENKTYGECDFCGSNISEERLEVIPEAHLCINCQKNSKIGIETIFDSGSRPVEEEVIKEIHGVPFGEQFLDEDQDEMDDGLYILRDLETYGSSDSIQDILYVGTYKELNDLYVDHFGIIDEMDTISNEQYQNQLD